MAEKKNKEPADMAEALGQSGDKVKKVTGPVWKTMRFMDKWGRKIFGEPKNSMRQKRLQQAGQEKGGK